MRKAERKRLRRWYFDKCVFWAGHRFFLRKRDLARKQSFPEPKNDMERTYYEILKIAQDTVWVEAYTEAFFWYYGVDHLDVKAFMPARGKVSSKTIQVKRIDL